MRVLTRATAFLLLLAIALPLLCGCGESYKLRQSSEREREVVLRLGDEEVAFEVLYTFFLNRCEAKGVSPESLDDAAFAETLTEACREVAGIYAVLAVAREVGIDPYGEEVEEEILAHLRTNVEGGTFGEYEIEGFGDYDEYLAYIREEYHMTDAVNRLMIRYAVCEELLTTYYGTEYRYIEDDVAAFFESEDCIRVIWVGREKDALGQNREENYAMMVSARAYLLAGNHRLAIQYSTNPTTDFYMGRYTKDAAYYETLLDTAYGLEVGETSDILDLGSEGYFAVKRLPKLTPDLDSRYEEILVVFLFEMLYRNVEEKKEELLLGASYTDAYRNLTAGDFFDDATK